MDTIKSILEYLDSHNLYPDLRIIQGGAEPEVLIDGKKVLMFSSNNYLGLATHPKVIAAAVEAVRKPSSGDFCSYRARNERHYRNRRSLPPSRARNWLTCAD